MTNVLCDRCKTEVMPQSRRDVLGMKLCTPCRAEVGSFARGELPSNGGTPALQAESAPSPVDTWPAAEYSADTLDGACELLLKWVASLDPSWEERLRAMREERALSPRQVFGSLVAYVLDHGMHMAVVGNPAFEAAFTASEKVTCAECGEAFEPKYMGQPLCGNTCADLYYAKQRALGGNEGVAG